MFKPFQTFRRNQFHKSSSPLLVSWLPRQCCYCGHFRAQDAGTQRNSMEICSSKPHSGKKQKKRGGNDMSNHPYRSKKVFEDAWWNQNKFKVKRSKKSCFMEQPGATNPNGKSLESHREFSANHEASALEIRAQPQGKMVKQLHPLSATHLEFGPWRGTRTQEKGIEIRVVNRKSLTMTYLKAPAIR